MSEHDGVHQFFFEGEDHTFACMIRDFLLEGDADDQAITACVVTDGLYTDAGVTVTCSTQAQLVDALDRALALLDVWDGESMVPA